ncbi:hypothetical protein NKH77_46680 [Streptomyces sp. M19]
MLLDRLDVSIALLVFAGVYVSIAMAPLLFTVWRELDAPGRPPERGRSRRVDDRRMYGADSGDGAAPYGS